MPAGVPAAAALVLPGSSNRVDTGRARLLADHGVAALPLPLFDEELEEVPLERFGPALDTLASISLRLAVIGVSKGAEAALLLAAGDARITAVAAFAPSSVVWAGLAGRQRSSWTRGGLPLPFVPYDETWVSDDDSALVPRALRAVARRGTPVGAHPGRADPGRGTARGRRRRPGVAGAADGRGHRDAL